MIMKVFKKMVVWICAASFIFLAACSGPSGGTAEMNRNEQLVNADLESLDDYTFTYSQLSGTDALGRQVTSLTGVDSGKYVGIFYFVWMGYSTKNIYDISLLNEEYPDYETSPLWTVSGEYYDAEISPNGAFHYWGEPLYGYYDSGDPWVIRRHLELLSAVGVDYLLLDHTNAITYNDTVRTLLETVLQMQAEGLKAPQVSFLLPNDQSNSVKTLKIIYQLWYSNEKYDTCWFRADSKMNPSSNPLVIGRFENALEAGEIDSETASSLWLKEMQWPTTDVKGKDPDSVPWMDWVYPQTNHNGVMSVSVAQHVGGTWSSEAARYPDKTVFSARGWTEDTPFDSEDKHGVSEENVMSGTNFELQWNTALKENVDMVIVTGFNEWIAQKLSQNVGNIPIPSYRAGNDHAVFVDAYDMAYSRDVEMMKGGYGDNYLMQLAINIRKFKGLTIEGSDNLYNYNQATVLVNDFAAWDTIGKKYIDFGYDCMARDYNSVDPSIRYTDVTNRNDIDYIKIANDGEYLYILAVTKDDITPYNGTDKNWMNVYLSFGNGGKSNFDFVINRSPLSETTSVEKITEEGDTQTVGNAVYAVQANKICFGIPLSVLGAQKGDVVQIKVTDNLQKFLDTDDFYISGDSAPIGRLNYSYKIA